MNLGNTPKQQIPAVKGWFTMPPQEPRLMASKCKSCGHYFFPPVTSCRNPNCTEKGGPLEDVLLNNRGKLINYTVNYYPPPPPYHSPDPFVPFGVGIVKLPEGISITGQIAAGYEEGLKMGIDMEVIIEKLYEDEQGNDVLAWKFRPVKS